MKGGRLSAEMLVGVSAVFIGVCALLVSLYETTLMREEQRSAVLPILELGRSYNVDNSGNDKNNSRLLLLAENVGIGPARVSDFVVTVDGEKVSTWDEAMRRLLGRDVAISYGQSTIFGRTIPPERQIVMFNLNETEHVGEIIENFDRLNFEACFCSVFDECWATSYSLFGKSLPVENCEPSEWSFTE